MHSRVWLEIDLGRLRANFRRIRDHVAPCGVIAVLKANAYGLGVTRIAEALAAEGAAAFAVAEPKEALQIRSLGIPVQVLGGMLAHELRETVAAGLIHPITSRKIARAISAEAQRQGRTVECQIKIDTGMGRMGILHTEAIEAILECVRLPGLDCSGLYSHFPVAYRDRGHFTSRQISIFLHILEQLADHGVTFRKIHIANSDAINNFPDTHRAPFTHVRTGINLHGSFDSEGRRVLKLDPILTLKARLVQIRRLPAGMNIGYGLTHTLAKDTMVGTVAAGYADGLPLALSNHGELLIRGQLCPILGRVSMDYVVVSLEGCPDALEGDEVICLGGDGVTEITVDQWARLKQTHPYEIICSFGSRVERFYRE